MSSLNRAALLKHAELCLKKQAFVQLQGICGDLLRENKNDPEVWSILGRMHLARGRHSEALKYFKKCVAQYPRELKFMLALAGTYSAMAQHDLAMQQFTKAFRLKPDDPRIVAGLVEACEKAGDIDRGREVLEPFLDRCATDAGLARAYALIAMADKRPQDAVDLLRKHAAAGPVPRSSLFILGKAYEKLKDADNAFEMYRLANEADVGEFELQTYVDRVEQLMSVFTRENLANLPRPTTRSELAVFVAGRPRSGTTLISKIIGAHPLAVDVGEVTSLNDIFEDFSFTIESLTMYPESILEVEPADVEKLSRMYLDDVIGMAGPKAQRIVDKSLLNHYHMGLASLILPKAHVLHVNRNPVDNCLACYSELLIGSHTYATSLRALGLTHWLAQRLWRHWHEVLDIAILEVNYEDVVADQEGMTRKMIDFVGLPWDDACLKFYEAEKDKPRSTAALTYSYDQVRKPVYNTSVGRAKMFEKHLAPLYEALAEGEARWGPNAAAGSSPAAAST